MSVLDGSPRSAAVLATSDLETLGLSAWNMRTIIREEPDIAMHVIDMLVSRIRAQNEAMFDCGQPNAGSVVDPHRGAQR